MTTPKITPVILAGGQGRRLWPISTVDHPKQFIPIANGKSLFEQTIERCVDRSVFNPPIIIGNARYKQIIKPFAPNDAEIIIEPTAKNTAAAIALAAMASNKDEILLIMPSDHFIPDHKGFINTVLNGVPFAQNNKLVTFGITPTSANTGFGYIQSGKPIGVGFEIQKFHEKPKRRLAKAYSNDNQYFWNAGLYMAKTQTIVNELNEHAPTILTDAATPESFNYITPISFDHAVAERTINGIVIPATFEWSDIGSWKSLIKLKAGLHE